MELVEDVPKAPAAWGTIFKAGFYAEYAGLVRAINDIPTVPQSVRNLVTEGDVSDLVNSNILQPVLPILNRLLPDHLKNILEITVTHQAKVRWPNEEASPSMTLDHAIVITRHIKTLPTLEEGKSGPVAQQNLPPQGILVIVEAKRGGYVCPQQWTSSQLSNRTWMNNTNVEALLGQLIAYGICTNCTNFVLTDHNSAAAVFIRSDVEDEGRQTTVAAYPYRPKKPRNTSKSASPNPIDRGIRHTVCMMAVKAMYDFGILEIKSLQAREPDVSWASGTNFISFAAKC